MKAFAYLVALVASSAVGVLASDSAEGVKIDVTKKVECERKTQKGDKIQVHYRGTLASNGEKFDASYDRGSPFAFSLGGGQVIKGWDVGLLDMCIGEKRTLTIAPEFGYGDRGIGPIPAKSTLIFETELMGIDGVPKPEPVPEQDASEEKTGEEKPKDEL
ncbi:unnamed protein product [Parascedosporium putredinis]|uniref:peptidylprolyl isomerase n=1 Tax=Parascedosporium putredinis TaxID=1442378 RepID=A0A9P1MAN3_9PEZI|nr:unnamed protein product [Parascedosporium putredinis]CAI7994257.1 unnamed protein product [Parascedosporium putredinis]